MANNKKKSIKSILPLLVMGMAGGIFGYVGGRFIANNSLDLIGPIGWTGGIFLTVIILPLSYFLAVLVHELGHTLVGMAQGLRFFMISVGPFGLRRGADDAINPYVVWGKSSIGGMSVTLPLDDSPKIKGKFVALLLAGPLASLIAGISMLLLSLAMLETATLQEKWVWIFFLIFGLLSIFIGVGTILPLPSGGIFRTDGGRALRLLRKGPAAEEEVATLKIIGWTLAGKPYRDIPQEWINNLPDGKGINPNIALIRYAHSLDTRALEEAKVYLQILTEQWEEYPVAFRGQVALEVAYGAAALHHDLDSARRFWAEASEAIKTTYVWSTIRARAAILYREGDEDGYHAILDELATKPRTPIWEMPESQIRWIKMLKEMP